MKNISTILSLLLSVFILTSSIFAQTEILTNTEIILMSQAGLSQDLIIRKIKESKGSYDTDTKSLIELKKSGVSDEVIKLMMDNDNYSTEKQISISPNELPDKKIFDVDKIIKSLPSEESRIVISPNEALTNAKTIAIKKSSLHPSRQSLEKELLKRDEWKELNLNIVRYKQDADLLIEIGYVSMSWLTHRYVYRVYDNNSGTVIVAGETTSWGSLSENLARGISKRLSKAMKNR